MSIESPMAESPMAESSSGPVEVDIAALRGAILEACGGAPDAAPDLVLDAYARTAPGMPRPTLTLALLREAGSHVVLRDWKARVARPADRSVSSGPG